MPTAPGVFPQIEPNPNFYSETEVALELGYRAQVTRTVDFDAALFHNIYNHLSIAVPFRPAPPVAPEFEPIHFVNGASGHTDGGELAVNWRPLPDIRLYGAYTLMEEHIQADLLSPFPPQLTLESPEQQVFLQASFDLPHHIELDVIGRWVDELPGFLAPGTPAYFALDLRLAWMPTKNLEFALVGQDLNDDHHPEFGSNPFVASTPTQIKRSLYAKVTWRF